MRFTIAVLLLAATAANTDGQAVTVDAAGWLAGCWEQRSGTRVMMEMWLPPLGGTMLGASRIVIDGATREFEFLRLAAHADSVVYTAMPSGHNPVAFRATAANERFLRFENPAHDFPQVIGYRRVGADSVVARIEGPGPNNSTRGIDFPMRRVSCTETPAPTPPPDTLLIDVAVSPDGRQLLVVKGAANNWDVYLVDTGGAGSRRLTDHSAVDYQPDWSPDGSRIAFTSTRNGRPEIYTVRADGSEIRQLTHGVAASLDPVWSPLGTTIAFQSIHDGRPQIFLMNPDGTDQRRLTYDSAGAAAPSWSPDGRSLLFASPRNRHNEIHRINADGTGAMQLTNTPQGHSGLPFWSPDGRSILFWSNRDGNEELYVMNADGTGVRNISNHPARDTPLGWTPDGAHVLFRSLRDRAAGELYRVRPDGTGLYRLPISR